MSFRNFTILTTVFAIGLGVNGAALAQNSAVTNSATPIANMEDESSVVLTGKVGEIRDDEFDLRYQGNMVTVELDRFGWDADEATQLLRSGESVTVSGYIDDDLFEGREIKAHNVRFNDRDLYYYTNQMIPVYEDSYSNQNRNDQSADNRANHTLSDGTYVTMAGTVSGISGNEFTLTGNNRRMTVDVSELGYEPFSQDRYQRIQNGDRVYIYGQITDEFFDSKEIVASSMTKMMDNTRGN